MNTLLGTSEPQATRFDLFFTIARFPVRIHPLFWLMTLMFGGSNNEISRMMIWIGVVFTSVLVHELGHALVLRRFGQSVHIVLHGGGGLAVSEPVAWGGGWAGVALSTRQRVMATAAGPLAGFLLAALVVLLSYALGGSLVGTRYGIVPWVVLDLPAGLTVLQFVFNTMLFVNLVWGLMNLMPVYPLDGGQIARELWLRADPVMGVTRSLWVSFIVALVMATAGLATFGSPYLLFLFALLAVQSYQGARSPFRHAF